MAECLHTCQCQLGDVAVSQLDSTFAAIHPINGSMAYFGATATWLAGGIGCFVQSQINRRWIHDDVGRLKLLDCARELVDAAQSRPSSTGRDTLTSAQKQSGSRPAILQSTP